MPEMSKRDQSHDRFFSAEARGHLKAAREEMRKSIEALFPPGLAEHQRAARKEGLLAVRSVIDAALVRMEERAKKG